MGILDSILGLFRRKDAFAWTAEARELVARGRHARALAAAERAVAMAPEDPDLRLLRAGILRELHLPERALEDVLAALHREPGRAPALLALLEELEPSAPAPEAVWLHSWRVRAGRGEFEEAAARVHRIAGRGAAAETLRAQCRAMLDGSGDRTAAQVGLALLAREKGDSAEAVKRILEATAHGGRPALAFADRFLSELSRGGREAPGLQRALVTVRVLLGRQEEAREAVVALCRKDADVGVGLIEELLRGDASLAEFALSLMAGLEKSGRVPVRLSMLLAEELLRLRRGPEAATVVLRAVTATPEAAEAVLPIATRVMKQEAGLDALEAHGRAAALAGDDHSCLLTVAEFVDRDPGRAAAVLALLPGEVLRSRDGALLSARSRGGLGDHPGAAAELRRWSLGGGGEGAAEALPHVRAAAAAHPCVPAYALLLHDLLDHTGDAAGAGRVLHDLVVRFPGEAAGAVARAAALLERFPGTFEVHLAAARAGLAASADPGAILASFRSALEAGPARAPEVLACLEEAAGWVRDSDPLELFLAERVLDAGRLEEGLSLLERVAVRNPSRGGDALAVLRTAWTGCGAGNAGVLLAEHRVRRMLRDHEGCVVPLRRVADLDESRREEVLAAMDAVLAEAPACRGAHRGGVEIALRLGRPVAHVLRRLAALLDIPTPPRDTEYVTRRAATLQAAGATVDGHRLLARCHIFSSRFPLALEEVRAMTALDPSTRGEAVGFLNLVAANPGAQREARFQLAAIHASLGDVASAREALKGALPRTGEVFEAWRRLVEAYPTHVGARLDLVDALVAERRIDDALEECSRILGLPGGADPELVRRIERILDLSPEYAPALYGLANVHHARGEWGAEIAACRRVLRLAPREAEVVLQRLDLILDAAPGCLDASLEILRLVPLHQRTERAASEGRRALEAAGDGGRAAEVADVIEALAEHLSGDPAFVEVLAAARSRAGRTAAAVASWSRLLDLAPDRAAAAARELERLSGPSGDDATEAVRLLSRARLLAGDASGACAAAAAFLGRRPGEFEEARRLYRAVLELHPSSREAAEGLAAASVEAKDPDGAVEAALHGLRHHPERRRDLGRFLAGLRERFPRSARVPLAQAEYIHLPLDLLPDAAAALEAAFAIDPSLHGRVLALAELVLTRDPGSAPGTRVKGRALAEAGRLDEAVAAFRALADLDGRLRGDALAGLDGILEEGPGHPQAQFQRAALLRDLGRGREAEAQAAALAAAVRPGDPLEHRTLLLLADARETLGDFDGALEALRLAVARHPRETGLLPRIRANMAARLAARTAALRAAAAKGGAGGPALELAEVLLDAGDRRGALTAVGPQPDRGESLARWHLLRGRAFLALGDGGAALDELEAAVSVKGVDEAKPGTGRDAVFFLGLAHLRAGEPMKASRRLEQVGRVAPEHRRVREILDRVYDEDRRKVDRALALTDDLESLPRARAETSRG